ncbi:phosphotransferase enzyme family protein [Tenggerimyces flavus]|uniref:Phosphotransferase enzyme family protein n=1 Tax=Tenggerimyces flavus TaxID=1708749 RepID=A0ABV7YGT3_9ACTN|nr:aminoglycoside phosphotransferase family protein [Tenggerimyces flavus]MBM7787851.1 Ser/Thr protein kinase RdoA (MazF antagonist) [Tenggerimyces flavus]
MTKDASFKKVVRRHAKETGQRYTEALTELEGLDARMRHEPAADRLLAHLRGRYGIDPVAATKLSLHATYVFRIDRNDGNPWIARAFPPARPRSGAEGDAAILRFLERQSYPAERLAVDDAVSDFEGCAVLVTEFVEGELPPKGSEIAIMADLLGRLHALQYDEDASRPGGACGEDPSREGAPRQDLLAALSFLDAVDTKVAAAHRQRFEQLRDQVRDADDGDGLPESLLHGNIVGAPDHAIVSEHGPVAINWMASGRGPRLTDFAYLMWGTWLNQEEIDAGVTAYRRHVELTDDELDRLEAVMRIRPLYLMAGVYRRDIDRHHDGGAKVDWKWFDPEYIRAAAAATRAAFRRVGHG